MTKIFMRRYLCVLTSEAGICRVSVSTGPHGHLKSLQFSSDYRLSLVETFQVPAAVADEIKKRVADLLKGARVFGEWFKVPPETAVVALRLAVKEVTGTTVDG
ncbi:MAG TPA: hypothetical protein VGN93_13225 [Shinella sp.]|jgi:hypothetical protein|uniref:hypothetical protein n=1 Tax=Shinella sp. TaxID=1870904 RepID=UPI002E14C92A|nr:hypothetical protein [Shinella sp.]